MLVAASVEAPPLNAPPSTPVTGGCYIVGDSPDGEWSGHPQHLAAYTSGGWRFLRPCDGVSAIIRRSGNTAVYRDGSWDIGTLNGSRVDIEGQKVVGPRGKAISIPTGGNRADPEARATIEQILAAMREHGLIEM